MKMLTFAAMKSSTKQNLVLLGVHLAVWLLVMLAPASVSYMINPNGHHWGFMIQSISMLGPMFIVYMVSFYVLVPLLLFRGHKWQYIFVTIALILLVNFRIFLADVSMLDGFVQTSFYVWMGSSVFIQIMMAVAAFALQSYLRTHHLQVQLEEERRKTAEAELTWLKNQLNPHFLFNSLNNISSLTQIDPDQAQDAIAQLSDLLRYALYESNKPAVSLSGEVEFMRNYISMMKLRCSHLTTISVDFPATCPSSVTIAPLLFISFIENAFKHGVSNNQESEISVSLKTDHGIVFECVNTNLPKGDTDKSGSGIGLENTRRRLDLLYAGRYEWQQEIIDGLFKIRVLLNNE